MEDAINKLMSREKEESESEIFNIKKLDGETDIERDRDRGR